MENTVAIELLSQNLKWELNKIFNRHLSGSNLIISSELHESKSLTLADKVITFENYDDIKTLKQIIMDIIGGNRIVYSK